MTLQRADVVDWLGLEKGTGIIVLTLVDDEDWTNEHEHLRRLQAKLNGYLAFIESGEVFDRLATEFGFKVARSTPIKVSVLAKHALPAEAVRFLAYAQDTCNRAGYTLVHEVLQTSG